MRRLTLLTIFGYVLPSLAWGPEGHRLVAGLAQEMLTPAAEIQVRDTLRPGETLVSMASWADDVRRTRKETEPWHFIDIEITGTGLDMRRDCPHNDCVLAKITEFRKLWRDPAAKPETRREALLFLDHFVGDMHQPLHCADNHDKGGNEVHVVFQGAPMNLHHLWDSGLLDLMPSEDELLVAMTRDITPEKRAAWARGSLEDWARESFQVARSVVYGNLPKTPPGETPRLGDAYQAPANRAVEEQIEKAGVRLATILNEMP